MARTRKLTSEECIELLEQMGWVFGPDARDVYTLSMSEVDVLQGVYKLARYTAPPGNKRNGSAMRYFYEHLRRVSLR